MVGKKDYENHLVESYSDALRNIPLNKINGIVNPRRKLTVVFNAKKKTYMA